jgi:hypothetical protein
VTTINYPSGIFQYLSVFVAIFIQNPSNGRPDVPAIWQAAGKKLSRPLIFATLLIIFLTLALNGREC